LFSGNPVSVQPSSFRKEIDKPLKTFQVEYETTLPPWRIGHEQIEAEDPIAVKKKFYSKHGDHSLHLLRCFESMKKTIHGRT